MKLCECGCGEEVKIGRDSKKPNRFVRGHQMRSQFVKKLIGDHHRGKNLSVEHRKKLSENHNHVGMTGLKHTDEAKSKMSSSHGGLKRSEETKRKIGNSTKGKHHSLLTRQKISIAVAKYICVPRRGSKEDLILDQLELTIKEKIIRNSFDIGYKIGKFPDGYISKCNLVIEIDEPFHYQDNNKLRQSDIDRELILSASLSCMIYRIKEQEFLKNSEKEIQRFLNFYNLINQI